VEGHVFLGLQKLIKVRKGYRAFSGGELEIVPTGSDHVLGYVRTCGLERGVVFANFSEFPQTVLPQAIENLAMKERAPVYGTGALSADMGLELQPLEFLVYAAK
jgi:glycosidase